MERKYWIILLIVFIVHIFLRFYDIENRNSFGWDQIDNAWAAKTIIVDHRMPLAGPAVKQNTGFFLGPAYYYLITPFYWFFNLDPIASGVFAGVTSIFTFFVVFYVTKKLFSTDIALIAVFIHSFSHFIIDQERIQWNVNFIESISLIIFYALYMVINRRVKYLLLLAMALGFSFHVHFTSAFFPVLILLALPLFPRTIATVTYGIISFLLFIVWLMPSLINDLAAKGSSSRNMVQYMQVYYHGFHLTRVSQLLSDAFIEFEEVLGCVFKPLKYIILPAFLSLYVRPINRQKITLAYLMILWIMVPWIAFSTYSGEISNYYFSITRPIVIMSLSYVTFKIFHYNYLLLKIITILFWTYFSIVNIQQFFVSTYRPLAYYRKEVENAIHTAQEIKFSPINPQSYIYYVYKRNENISNAHKK